MRSGSDGLLTAALAYAKRGWPVFPLVPENKKPLTSNGFKAATTDRDLVLAWWHTNRFANIGIATGEAFDVLDIDGETGRLAFIDFLKSQEAYPYVHSGPVSRTGKGYHLLFAPTGRRNRTKLAEATIDFRGAGGYIVAPPSVHPLGHPYQWDTSHGRSEHSTPPEAPTWLMNLLGEDVQPLPEPPTGVIRHDPKTGAVIVQGVKSANRPDILIVANSLGITYKIRGDYAMATCPFHKDDTPSLALYMDPQNKFYCHGCFAKGVSFDLADHRDMTGRSFASAS
jgi:hypothetical protein